MFKAFFGLRERPFDLTSEPRFLFLSKGHREALSVLHYGMAGDKGITVLTGEAGTGKTTMLRAACVQQPDSPVQPLQLYTPLISPADLHEFLAHELQLHPLVAGTNMGFQRTLAKVLHERRLAGNHTALLIDEAQALPAVIFEELRMLANLESPAGRLLSIVLTGQPELAQRLNEQSLRAFKQRIALRTTLGPLSLQETACYIAKRVQVAGGSAAELFTADAVEAVHRASRGIARTISVICDNALIAAFALRERCITEPIVREVCGDLDLDTAPPPSAVPPPLNVSLRRDESLRVVLDERLPDAQSAEIPPRPAARAAGAAQAIRRVRSRLIGVSK